MLKVTASKLRYFWYTYISYQMYANWFPPLLINFSIFFHPGHSYSNPPPINYWGKFPTETNVLKQYTCADLLAMSQKEWPIYSDPYFTKIESLLMFLLNVLLDLTDNLMCFADNLNTLLLIVCSLVSFWPYCFTLFLLKNAFDSSWK